MAMAAAEGESRASTLAIGGAGAGRGGDAARGQAAVAVDRCRYRNLRAVMCCACVHTYVRGECRVCPVSRVQTFSLFGGHQSAVWASGGFEAAGEK